MSFANRDEYTPGFSLDALIASEELIQKLWVDLALHRHQNGGVQHPVLRELALQTWQGWGAISRERRACERSWGR